MIKISFDFETPEQAAEFLAGFDETTKRRASTKKPTNSVQHVKSKLAKAQAEAEDEDAQAEKAAQARKTAEEKVTEREAESAPRPNKAAREIMEQFPDVPWAGCPVSGKKNNILKSDVLQHLRDLGIDPDKPADEQAPEAPAPESDEGADDAEVVPDKAELADALKALITATAAATGTNDKKLGQARGRDLLKFFGASKLSEIKLAERKLFLDYARLGSVLSPTWTPTHLSKLYTEAGKDIDAALKLAEQQDGFLPESDAEPVSETPEPETGTEAQPEAENAENEDDAQASGESDGDTDGPTKLEVQQAIQNVLSTKGLPVALDLLKKFGVRRVAELEPAQYAEVIAEAQASGGSE